MSKILILGGHGFIGCHTSNILKQKKHDLTKGCELTPT